MPGRTPDMLLMAAVFKQKKIKKAKSHRVCLCRGMYTTHCAGMHTWHTWHRTITPLYRYDCCSLLLTGAILASPAIIILVSINSIKGTLPSSDIALLLKILPSGTQVSSGGRWAWKMCWLLVVVLPQRCGQWASRWWMVVIARTHSHPAREVNK